MAESFENLENILRDWAKGTKKSCRGIEQVRKAGIDEIKPFLQKLIQKKFSSSLKSNTK